MVGAGRAIAGVAVAVAVALGLFVAFRGHDAGRPAGSAGTGTAAPVPAGTAAAGGFQSAGAGAGAGAGAAAAQAASSLLRSPVVPAAVPAAPHANPLSGAAASYAAGRSGTVLAAVYDLRTGQSWRLGGGPAQDEASIVKLDILETLLARPAGAALSHSDKALARSMIEDSDNDAATSLWDKAGGAAGLSAYNDRAGLTRTTPSPCVACAGFAWPGWGLSTTVPDDQLALLRQLIVPGSRPLLSDAARSYALSLMENVAPGQRWGVSGGVPAGVTMALKNGWLPLAGTSTDWQVNSVGWIDGDGRDYLIAVLSTGNPTEQYGIDTIGALSARVWGALR